MFLHLGGDVMIPTNKVIGIFDYRAQEAPSTQEFLSVSDEEGFIQALTEKPNSFVVTNDKIFLSPISALTLKKRANELYKQGPMDKE